MSIDAIYVIHHTHTDVGFTNDQPIFWEMQYRFIDEALRLIDRYADNPPESRFRWPVETTCGLDAWLKTASSRDIDRLIASDRAGLLEVMAMQTNNTPLLNTVQLIESLRPVERLRKEYGLDIRHAMNCDLNGHNWTVADILLDAGIKGFSMERFPEEAPGTLVRRYADLRINGLEKMADVVHRAREDCKIIAQLEVGYLDAGPSSISTPFSNEPVRELSRGDIEQIVACFVDAITDIRDSRFDGVQLHGAHGGLLSRFLSPYTNRREDNFGGTTEKRAKIIREIVAAARQQVGDFPILIKMNCTDYLAGGVDVGNFPALAQEIARVGVDAIEISGGMWECLFRSEEELGFRPVPAPESHTRIGKSEQQSYFLPYAEKLRLPEVVREIRPAKRPRRR